MINKLNTFFSAIALCIFLSGVDANAQITARPLDADKMNMETLDSPKYSISDTTATKAVLDIVVEAAAGCTIRATGLSGTQFSLQSGDKPELRLVASLANDGRVSLKRIVARVSSDQKTTMLLLRNVQPDESKSAFGAAGVKGVVASFTPSAPVSKSDTQKYLTYDGHRQCQAI